MRVQAVFFDVGYTLFDETRLWREWAQWLVVSDEMLFAALRVAIEERAKPLRDGCSPRRDGSRGAIGH
jgi:hypothetical protein